MREEGREGSRQEEEEQQLQRVWEGLSVGPRLHSPLPTLALGFWETPPVSPLTHLVSGGQKECPPLIDLPRNRTSTPQRVPFAKLFTATLQARCYFHYPYLTCEETEAGGGQACCQECSLILTPSPGLRTEHRGSWMPLRMEGEGGQWGPQPQPLGNTARGRRLASRGGCRAGGM